MSGPAQSVLEHTVAEIERHVADHGWDQPPRLYALVGTADLLASEPQLAAVLGLDPADPPVDGLTPVEQEALPEGPLDDALAGIAWPGEVLGCAVVTEVVVLPPGAEDAAPDDGDLTGWAAAHPQRRDVRIAVAVLRNGSRATRLRVRSGGDSDDDVVTGSDLAPNLADALLATLAE
jgi:hypothetical protein